MNSEVPPNPPNELPRDDSKQPPSTSSDSVSHANSQLAPEQPLIQQHVHQLPVIEPPVKEQPRRGWHRPLLAAVFLGFLCYSVLIPVAIHSLDSGEPSQKRRMEPMPLSQLIEVHSMKAIAVLWIISLGATVGSFLNVVAYRMPRNKSVVLSASRCPKCNSSIRPTDNVPIFGWLRLEGRCRNCGNSISSQYPIVEALTASIFLLLFSVELVSGGANLPLRTPNLYAGIVWVLFELRWDLILYFLYHCLLFCLVLSWMLIDLDRQKVTPLAILVSSLLVVAPLIDHPYLLPVPAIVSLDSYPPALPQALLSSLIGGIFGLAIGATFARIYYSKLVEISVQEEVPTERKTLDNNSEAEGAIEDIHSQDQRLSTTDSSNPLPLDHHSVPSARNVISVMLLIGLSLGWQAVWTIAIAALSLRLICYYAMQVANYRLPLSLFVLVGLTVHHTAWRWIFCFFEPCWFGDSFSATALIALVIVFVTLLLLNRFSITPARTTES